MVFALTLEFAGRISMTDQIIIVGASNAGISCAEQLRANGYAGRIYIIDRLVGAPLERPPLSKAFL